MYAFLVWYTYLWPQIYTYIHVYLYLYLIVSPAYLPLYMHALPNFVDLTLTHVLAKYQLSAVNGYFHLPANKSSEESTRAIELFYSPYFDKTEVK